MDVRDAWPVTWSRGARTPAQGTWAPAAVAVHDAVQADRGVAEGGPREDDEQVEAGERLGLQQVVEERQVDPGELEAVPFLPRP